MAYITSLVCLHPSYSKLQNDQDGSYACIIVKGNKEYEIHKGTFMVKLHLAESPCQIIPLCKDNHEIIVHGHLVEFERGLIMTIRANSAKVHPVPKRDFQHPSLLAIAGTIARTSASSFSDEVTWFDISCADNLTSSTRSSQSQPISGILPNSDKSGDRKSCSTSRSGSTSSGSKVTFDNILFPKHTKSGSDKKAAFFEESYEDDEISGTIRRVDATNSDYFSSSAPATAYPPRAHRSATLPLPPHPSAPLSRPRARTGNVPLSGIQVNSRARDFSSHGNRPIDQLFAPRPLFGPVDSFRLSQSNEAGGRMNFQTLDKGPSTSALPSHRAPDPFIPSKIIRAVRSISNMEHKASFQSEAHDKTAHRPEDLLRADTNDLQVDLSVGMEFDGRSIPASGFINPTLQAARPRYPTHRDRRRGIYGTPVSSIGGASVPKDIAHCEQHDLVKTGWSTGETALGSKQAQIKSLHSRKDAAFFGEKPEIERPKTASKSTGQSLARTRTTSTASSEPTLFFTIRCFLPKGDHPFQNLDFSVGRQLAVIGELQGIVGEGPDRTASIIVSEIGPYSLGTDNAEKLNNCCGVSCTEQNPVTTGRPLAALDLLKVDSKRDLIRKARGVDDSLQLQPPDIKPNLSLDGAERRSALSEPRKVSSGRNIRSKVTQLFTRSGSKTSIPTPPEYPENPATTPRSASSNEGSGLEHARAGLNATLAANDVATPWSNNPTRAGLRKELPHLRTVEAQALARQSFLPKLSRLSPLNMEPPPPVNIGGLPVEAGFSPMTMTPQFNELSSPVVTRSPPLKMGPQPDRDLRGHRPAEKSARVPALTQRRNIGNLKLVTDQPFVFSQRATATDVVADPAGSEALTPTTPTPATCTTSWGTSPPPPRHHQQQQQPQHHPEIPLPAFTKAWTISEKHRAKKVIKALNTPLPFPPLPFSVSLPNLNFQPYSPSSPSPRQGIPKSHSAPMILPHREERVYNNVAAARSLAPQKKMRMIKEEIADDDGEEKKKKEDDEGRLSWYDSDSDYGDDEMEEGDSTGSMLS